MTSRFNHLLFLGALTLGFILTGCRDAEKVTVDHQEFSKEETEQAIHKAYIEQTDGAVQEVPAGVDRFFNLLGKATRSGSSIDADLMFSLDGMVSALESSGSLDSFSSSQKRSFKKGMQSAMGQLGDSLTQMAYDNHKIQLVERIKDGQVIVYTRLYDNELGIVSQVRWWLLETDKGWRIFDFEDLSIGFRTVSLMATLMKNGAGGSPEPWVAAFIPIGQQLQSLDPYSPESFEALRKPVERLRSHQLPEDIARFASTILVSIHQVNDRAEEALAELKNALENGFSSPLYSYQMGSTLAMLEQHPEALVEFNKHCEKFGFDSDILELIADSHLALDDLENARKSSLAGLAENPASVGCLVTLVASTPADEILQPDIAERFAATSDPESSYEIALDYLLDEEDEVRVRNLLVHFKENHSTSDLISYYEEALDSE